MRKQFLLLLSAIIIASACYCQQFPQGDCGVVNVHDANGNRKVREYLCFTGSNWPTKVKPKDKITSQEIKETETFQPIEALYPNPTSGKFYVTFNTELKNAKVMLLDINGKIIQQSIGNGFKLNFDLSNVASGVYLMRVETEEGVITKKVIKQ